MTRTLTFCLPSGLPDVHRGPGGQVESHLFIKNLSSFRKKKIHLFNFFGYAGSALVLAGFLFCILAHSPHAVWPSLAVAFPCCRGEGLERQLSSPHLAGLPLVKGSLPEQGSNRSPLHCKVASQPLDYLESPEIYLCRHFGQLSQSREKRTQIFEVPVLSEIFSHLE